MTNKPMLSAELRALLERVATEADHMLGFTYASNYDECRKAVDELRAILDKPVDDPNLGIEMMRGAGSGILIQDHGAGWEAVTFNRGIRVSSFPIKGGYKETVVALKAAQHQVEPVAYLHRNTRHAIPALRNKWEPITVASAIAHMQNKALAKDGKEDEWHLGHEFQKCYAEQPAPVASVTNLMRAIHEIKGFPGVTGDQLRELAARLNGIKPKR